MIPANVFDADRPYPGTMRLALAMFALILVAATPPAHADHFDLSLIEYDIPPDSIGSIDAPEFESPDYVSPLDEVIGVALGGTAHAYPLKVLRVHEVVNDVVAGVPVTVTYCSLCGTAVAYERPLWNGTPLVFHTSGLLYRNNKVLYDTATWSLWPQILGEAVNGSLHGTLLRDVTATRTSWADWRGRHPASLVLARPLPEWLLDYNVDSYEDICIAPLEAFPYCEDRGSYYTTNYTVKEWRHPDRRLHPKAPVYGLAYGGTSVAYPMESLASAGVINDAVGGVRFVLTYFNGSVNAFFAGKATFTGDAARAMSDGSGGVFDRISGEGPGGALDRARGLQVFWFAWKDAHPDTRLYGVDWPPGDGGDPALGAVVVAVAGTVNAAIVLLFWRRATRRGR